MDNGQKKKNLSVLKNVLTTLKDALEFYIPFRKCTIYYAQTLIEVDLTRLNNFGTLAIIFRTDKFLVVI
jgi:hypothetical protein